MSVDTWKNQKVGSTLLVGEHVSPGGRSQYSIDFSCLRDSRDKSTRACTTTFGSNLDGAFEAVATFYCRKIDKPWTPSNVFS
jgi:hypothetical protein